jgi:hypothetical protein
VVRPSVALGLFEYGKTPGVGGQSGKTCSVGRDGLIEKLKLSSACFLASSNFTCRAVLSTPQVLDEG